MESRVMGNCHARFGAGENLEERVCSLRLHTSPKRLPIAILRDGSRCHGIQAAGAMPQIPLCRSQPPDGAVVRRVPAAVPLRQYPRGYEKGL